MQNQHVTPFPGNEDQYPGIPPENSNNAPYAVDPVLDGWNGHDAHQYTQPRYPIPAQQYYVPAYNQQQSHHQQQPAFQGYANIAQPEHYQYQAQPNQFAEPYYAGHAPQNNFSNGYEFEQPPPHETISPQALQVGDNIGSHSQNAFHHGGLGQRQVFERNPQQDQWVPERPTSSAHYPDLMNGQVVSDQIQNPRQRGGEYPAYSNSAVNSRGGASTGAYDSGVGQSANGPPPKHSSVPIPRPNPLRVTHQSLLDQYPSENDAAHRVVDLPFVVLSEGVTKLDIRGKTTIPKYHARGNSIGRKFAPRNDLFATRSAPSTIKKTRGPKVKKVGNKSKAVSSKALITKDIKSRLVGTQVSVKQGSPATPSLESSSGDSSDEESEEEESEEEEEMTILSWSDVRVAVRPTNDPAAAARYDAVSIVFKEGPQHGSITRDEVIKAVTTYEPFIVKLRDNYRSSVTALTEATLQKRQAQIPRLTEAKQVNYQALTNALKGTMEHGHYEIIKNLGTNHKTVVGLWTVMTDFVKADDYTNDLPLIVLELLAKFTGLTPELLSKLKFESIQKRVIKKGTDKMKELIAAISRNASEEPPEPGPLQKAILKPSKDGTPLSAGSSRTAGVKRQFDGEDTNANPAKKVASGTRSIATPKPSIAAKPAPQPNLFASLNRSTKPLPDTNGVNKTATKTLPPKSAAKPAAPTTSKFSDILASIEKPKPQPKAPVVPEGPPETPEERKKRERKESRRHLRVKWREGDELTQVKIFMQVEGEDEGRKDELVRDAHDDRSEGMMHKQRAQEEVDIDEDEVSGEIEYRPYPELSSVDFSVLDEKHRSENFTTRGGQRTFFTQQQEIQNRHETTELMVVYTDPSDIPPSAKEPPVLDEEPREEQLLGRPTAEWLLQRIQEVAHYGVKGARELASSRITGKHPNYVPPQTFHSMPQQQHQFTPQNQNFGYPAQSHSNNHTMSSNSMPLNEAEKKAKVDAILAKLLPNISHLFGKPFPANEPPDHLNERQKAEWWEGYNRDQALKASTQAAAAQQSQPSQPTMQQPQMPNYQQPAMSNGQIQPQFDLQSLLRQMSHTTIQAPVPAPPAPPAAGYDWAAWVQNNAANQAPQQQTPQWPVPNTNGYNFPAVYNGGAAGDNRYGNQGGHNQNWVGMPGHENNWGGAAAGNEKMQWESNNGQRGGGGNWNNRDRDDGNGNGGQGSNRKFKPYKAGTKPCRFFQEGKCAKGEKCTYSHTMDAFPPANY